MARTTVTRYCGRNCARDGYYTNLRKEKISASNRETEQVHNKPVELIKAKEFLSIRECGKLLGVSRWTIRRTINTNKILASKIGRRTLIRRSEIDKLFTQPSIPAQPVKKANAISIKEPIKPTVFNENECWHLKEIQSKFKVSKGTLARIIARNKIPKFHRGNYVFVPKKEIEKIFSQ